jgi:transposase
MSITRTFEPSDFSPEELAEVFLGWDGDRQARFFNSMKATTDTWSGTGWCQQCCFISEHLTRDGIETILKLGEWAADPYVSPKESS